jgi:ABC-type uncharacterized transport system substrate-binding protein
MAIKSKTKMGSMVGMNPTEIAIPNTDKKSQEKKTKAAVSVKTRKEGSVAGKLKYELLAGKKEKNLNVSVPCILYNAMQFEANKKEMTMKQFVNEILLKEMVQKYGFDWD